GCLFVHQASDGEEQQVRLRRQVHLLPCCSAGRGREGAGDSVPARSREDCLLP
ncbi:hypothetical protein chiPu_0024610, partial [Chiloscyllium punctatum]|nr:hypothetical protein [Chiloscyllium punctatum]